MKFSQRQAILNKIKKDIAHINTFPNKDSFISAYFSQGMTGHNEYSDNSMELSYSYDKIKSMDSEDFLNMIDYVLSKYVPNVEDKNLHQ